MKINDKVTWTSQANGVAKPKHGVIVAVITAGDKPSPVSFPTLHRGNGCGMSRNHTSYVVKVGGKIYWPRVSALVAL